MPKQPAVIEESLEELQALLEEVRGKADRLEDERDTANAALERAACRRSTLQESLREQILDLFLEEVPGFRAAYGALLPHRYREIERRVDELIENLDQPDHVK